MIGALIGLRFTECGVAPAIAKGQPAIGRVGPSWASIVGPEPSSGPTVGAEVNAVKPEAGTRTSHVPYGCCWEVAGRIRH
jgi:hypothetical protein